MIGKVRDMKNNDLSTQYPPNHSTPQVKTQRYFLL